MRIQFYIRYYTKPGESLSVTGNLEALENDDIQKAFQLKYLDNQFWYGTIEVNQKDIAKIYYSYVFKNAENELEQEGEKYRVIDISKTGLEEIQLIDTWNPAGEYENVFLYRPFPKSITQRT